MPFRSFLRASPFALLVCSLAVGCSGPSETDDEDTGELQTQSAPAAENIVIKLGETPALKAGALGVDSWVTHLTLTTQDELGLTAYGVDLDGSINTVLYLDYVRGYLVGFERTRRVGSETRDLNASLLADYVAEMQNIVAKLSPRAGDVRTQRLLDPTERAGSCAITGVTAIAAVALAGMAAIAVSGAVVTVPVALAATGIIAASGGTGAVVLGQVVNGEALSVAGVANGVSGMGRGVVRSVKECVTGRS